MNLCVNARDAITVETTEGAGTTFRIYLPFADPAKAKEPASAAA